ncbi:APC family permease [Azorhizobium sp. AG788]|uniref:APC family permease n=1 Tax=Azorhizobium sp. AG788 TaxID=2183897 RepID=UPI0031399A13
MTNHLKRDIGLLGLTFVAVSGVIGSGWLFAPLMAAKYAGPASLVAWGIGGIAVLLLALTFAEIMAILPVAGGIARVPMFSHGNTVAMAMGWSAWVGYNTTAPIEVEAMLRYLSPFLPWVYEDAGSRVLSWAGVACAGAMLVLFTVINALGVKFFVAINSTVTWVKIGIPLVVAAMLIASRFEPGNFVADGGFAPLGLPGILAAVSSGGIIFSFVGFRHVVDMAGEAKNPGFTVPAALIISILICFVIYAGLQLAFIGALLPTDIAQAGWANLRLPGNDGPLVALATSIGLIWMVSLLSAGAVVAPFGGALVSVGSNARLAFALAENKLFPSALAKLSSLGVPVVALLVNLVVSTLAFVLLPFDELLKLNSSAIILSFVVGPVAVVALRSLLPRVRRPFRLPAVHVLGTIAFAISTLVVYWSGWPTVERLGICLLVGLLTFVGYSRTQLRGSMDLQEGLWLVPYLIGLGLLSYLGTFQGIGVLPFGWDMVVVCIFSTAVFWLAVRSRLHGAKFTARMAREREIEMLEGGSALDALFSEPELAAARPGPGAR